ncbi:polyribonucleotide nucleotidyltransferase [Helicobacter sp. MIT 05-5293]|uniref:polyribonucleotide nucleotidyltransferase n=1 Tax=Helicobacter sp. MIT 05-5293 TaxID=1548149 RepID=UPI00051DE70F|nr:polyribonucleotide nucleotidyltransferase [Helicobacter sp. MIT 05-5293]TLD80115.1 polyribonucleotide nucleotidyltransferase [Helicobacter sp. MIT 05-5293]
MQQINLECENLKEQYTLNYVAKASNGALLYQNGGSVLLASVCAQENLNYDDDFLPLSVQYIEKAYAGGKFPSGFMKREGKPSEFEILTSRLIDRTLRPLFPKGYTHNTSIIVMVLSYDGQSDLQVNALNAAANALFVSDLPLESLQEDAVSGVRIGRINGQFLLNPTMQQLAESELDLFVSGKGDELLMIEMRSIRTQKGSNELAESDLLEALEYAKGYIAKTSRQYFTAFSPYKKPPFAYASALKESDENLMQKIKTHYHHLIQEAIAQMAKSERDTSLHHIVKRVMQEHHLDDEKCVKEHILAYKKQLVREMILTSKHRPDGRSFTQVRPISIQTNLLPCVHGSVLFTRGQTQALVSATFGVENDAQSHEMLKGKAPFKERFLFHYNFPGFSVGEASMIGSVGRRELGHGQLAKRALESSIQEDKTIRLVSEILESNGSSSMASVCGGSLALYACGAKVDSLIAGVAMGLVTCDEQYAILTDISGLEDHDGDMDFKVAGGYRGITAMQMDIKLGGISHEILTQALFQAKQAREEILQKMEEARLNIVLNEDILPKNEVFLIPPHKIVEVIGQGGKVIKDIIERFEVSIDLSRESGAINISASNKERLSAAKAFILQLIGQGKNEKVDLEDYEVGERFVGKIKKILDFGVFVELPRGGDGLVHISKITKDKSKKAVDLLQGYTELECEILGLNKGKIELGLIQSIGEDLN